MAYVNKNPSYYPFGIMLAIDFLTYNPENSSRSISEDLNLRNFFPGWNAFCQEEVLLNIQALTMNYSINGQYALLEKMYSYIDEAYPGFFPDER